jgi:hypothetical protein
MDGQGNDSGGGSRSDEPPQLATVRRLHLDDGDGSSATTTEEWYETERLTGHITGGARRAPPVDPPAPAQDQAPVVLDWRHAAAVPPPTALERLGRAARGYRRRRRGTQDADVPSPRARGPRRAVLPTASKVQPPRLEPHEDEPAADEIRAAQPSGPHLGLRESADRAPQRPKRRFAPSTNGRQRSRYPQLRRAAIVTTVVLIAAAATVIGVASQMNSTAAKPHQASLVGSTSRPGAALNTAANTVIAVLGTLERRIHTSPARHRLVQAHRHPRHATRDRTLHSSSQPSVSSSESTPPVAAPPSAPSTSPYSSTSPYTSSSSYSSSSSSPAYSPQPSASESRPAATKSAPQPSGPTGTGAGTVGSNCNPQCS